MHALDREGGLVVRFVMLLIKYVQIWCWMVLGCTLGCSCSLCTVHCMVH